MGKFKPKEAVEYYIRKCFKKLEKSKGIKLIFRWVSANRPNDPIKYHPAIYIKTNNSHKFLRMKDFMEMLEPLDRLELEKRLLKSEKDKKLSLEKCCIELKLLL